MGSCDCCNRNSLILHEVVYKKYQFVFFCPDCYWKFKAQVDTVIESFLNEQAIMGLKENTNEGGAE